MTYHDTERAAQQDLHTVLRLVDKGRIAVSEKTGQASTAAVEEIASLLRDGDFYELTPKKNTGIRPLARSRLTPGHCSYRLPSSRNGTAKKLALTKAGRHALGAPAADTLRLSWQRWLKTTLFDEFNRVDAIKGQHGKGKRSMTAVEGRRAVIHAALQQCPVGRWVKVDDFFRLYGGGRSRFRGHPRAVGPLHL